MVLGVLTDVIANPHRVDLVSLPLLGLVLWNLFMYLLLLAGWTLSRRRPEGRQPEAPRRRAESLLRWRRGSGNVRADVTALFQLRWQVASQRLTMQRWKRVLHLSAAGWAVGVALSLLIRGLVVEYRVGWESTFLDAGQVHAILSFLRLPALLLFPFQPFSVPRWRACSSARAAGRWAARAGSTCMSPCCWSWWSCRGWCWPRSRSGANGCWRARFPLDARDPYYRRVVSLLSASRVQLCLITHRTQDRAALSRVLIQEPDAGRTLISSPQGDVLRLLDLSGARAPAPVPPSAGAVADWAQRLSRSLFRHRGPPAGAAIDPSPGRCA